MWLIKSEEETDEKFGKYPESRTVEEQIKNSVIIVDKHSGPTSHQISQWTKEIFDLKKCGHSGTLDPAVTGVLPVALDNAVKAMPVLSGLDKEYVGVMHLHQEVPEEILKNHITSFIGKIKQTPPVKSAVARREREREIYFFDIVEIAGRDVLFKVGCEAGTYIRKLCVTGDTELFISNSGITNIKNLVETQTKDNGSWEVKDNFSTLCMERVNVSESKILKVQKFDRPFKILQMKTESGIYVKLTPDHEVLVSTINGPVWKEVSQLNIGDFIYSPSKLPLKTRDLHIIDLLDEEMYVADKEIKKRCIDEIKKKYGSIRGMYRQVRLDRKTFSLKTNIGIRIKYLKMFCKWERVKDLIEHIKTEKGRIIKLENKKLTKEMMYLLGLVASDGTIVFEKKCIRPTRIKFHNTNINLIDTFVSLHKKIFPSVYVNKKPANEKGLVEVDVTNTVLSNIAYSLGIISPEDKMTLNGVLYLDEDLIKAFLKGYFDGDGTSYFGEVNGRIYVNIEFATGFFLIAKRIYQLLKRIGIKSRIFRKKPGGGFRSREGLINVVRILGQTNKYRFVTEIGTQHTRKLKYFNMIKEHLSRAKLKNNEYVPLDTNKNISSILIENKINSRQLNLGGNFENICKNKKPCTRYLLKRVIKKLSRIVKTDELTQLKEILNSQFYIEKIKEIKEIEFKDNFVYDITVKGAHNFIPEGAIVVSNCHDLGQKISVGAHMTELRRTKVGNFAEKNSFSLMEIKDAYEFWKNGNESYLKKILIPVEFAIDHVKKIFVKDSAISSIANGSPVYPNGITRIQNEIERGETVTVFSLKNELVALGIAKMTSEEMFSRKKGSAVRTDRVFIDKGNYPSAV